MTGNRHINIVVGITKELAVTPHENPALVLKYSENKKNNSAQRKKAGSLNVLPLVPPGRMSETHRLARIISPTSTTIHCMPAKIPVLYFLFIKPNSCLTTSHSNTDKH